MGLRRPANDRALLESVNVVFLELVSEVAAKLKEPNTNDRKFEDTVKFAEQAAVLAMVW